MSRGREISSIHGSSYLRERVAEDLHLLYLHLRAFTRVRGIAFAVPQSRTSGSLINGRGEYEYVRKLQQPDVGEPRPRRLESPRRCPEGAPRGRGGIRHPRGRRRSPPRGDRPAPPAPPARPPRAAPPPSPPRAGGA